MKRGLAKGISVATLSLAFVWASQAVAQNTQENQNTQQTAENAKSSTNQAEANGMVRGVVALSHTLDAKSAHPGSQFEAKLESTVHLANGTDLPKGSMLMGQITSDDMNQSGTSKLALRFTQAKTKEGNTVPVRATIMEVFPPKEFNGYGSPNMDMGTLWPNEAEPNGHITKVDQIGAINGFDLHSNINSQNSGVFVSTKKVDVKLHQGTQLALAIGMENNGQQSSNGAGASR
jgi:hypothetical protein